MTSLSANVKALRVHDTTIPHLTFIEKIVLDELVRQGRAVIVNKFGRTPRAEDDHHVPALQA